MASTPFNIFENKGSVVWMLNESLNRLKLIWIQHAFNNDGRPVQTPPTFGSTKC